MRLLHRFASRALAFVALAFVALATAPLFVSVTASAQEVRQCRFDRAERLRVLLEHGLGLTLGSETGRLDALIAQARANRAESASLAVGALSGRPFIAVEACAGTRCALEDADRLTALCEQRSGGECVVLGVLTPQCFQQSYFPECSGPLLTRPGQDE
jgi:hypothetical protein